MVSVVKFEEENWDKIWALTATDSAFLEDIPDKSRLDIAFKLSFYRQEARFPKLSDHPGTIIIGYLADQVASVSSDWKPLHARTDRRRREQVLAYLNLKYFSSEIDLTLKQILDESPKYLKYSQENLKGHYGYGA